MKREIVILITAHGISLQGDDMPNLKELERLLDPEQKQDPPVELIVSNARLCG